MPFTVEQFLEVFKNYNLAVWPMQWMLFLTGVFIIVFGTRTAPVSDKAVAIMLAFLWLWMGIMYHLIFFAAINKAAYLFAAVFVVQGVLFFRSRNRVVFRFRPDKFGFTGALLMLFALVIYPAWGYFTGHTYPSAPTFGLPCPTTIFTLGILLWAHQTCPRHLLVIPLLWSAIGFFAAISLGITEDTGLLVSGVVAAYLLFAQKSVPLAA